MAHNSGLNGRDGGFGALQGTRLSEKFKDMIVGTSPGAQALKAGAFKTDISVYEAAEAKARAANSAARTQSCAGAPGEIFPWAETVLGPELLARVEPALLTPSALARRGESGSSLQVTPTRAELGVARTLGMTHEGDSAEEMLKAASALGTPARQPRPMPKYSDIVAMAHNSGLSAGSTPVVSKRRCADASLLTGHIRSERYHMLMGALQGPQRHRILF
jgi:hypothetical protein